MNKDLVKFSQAMNHLIYLTTSDEYGSSRSKGIENLSDLAEELNSIGIFASRGEWNENSMKLYISRLKNRYTIEQLMAVCDFELISRCAWEYYSGTTHEEIVHKKKYSGPRESKKVKKSSPVRTYNCIDGERWKESELKEVIVEDKKIIKKFYKSCKRKTPKSDFVP